MQDILHSERIQLGIQLEHQRDDTPGDWVRRTVRSGRSVQSLAITDFVAYEIATGPVGCRIVGGHDGFRWGADVDPTPSVESRPDAVARTNLPDAALVHQAVRASIHGGPIGANHVTRIDDGVAGCAIIRDAAGDGVVLKVIERGGGLVRRIHGYIEVAVRLPPAGTLAAAWLAALTSSPEAAMNITPG